MEEKKKTEEKKQTEEKKLYESEYRFMNVIWDNDPVNSTGLEKVNLLYGPEKTGGPGLCKE